MPDTADHRAAMHVLASERRRSGRPIWDHRIDLRHVWRNEDMTFEERRDEIVRVLRASSWLKGRDELDWVIEIVDNLADAANADEFDQWWEQLYDEADYDRAWIAIF